MSSAKDQDTHATHTHVNFLFAMHENARNVRGHCCNYANDEDHDDDDDDDDDDDEDDDDDDDDDDDNMHLIYTSLIASPPFAPGAT